jgi:hypothetical protein
LRQAGAWIRKLAISYCKSLQLRNTLYVGGQIMHLVRRQHKDGKIIRHRMVLPDRPMTGAEKMRRSRYFRGLFGVYFPKLKERRRRTTRQGDWLRNGDTELIGIEIGAALFDWSTHAINRNRWEDIKAAVEDYLAQLQINFAPNPEPGNGDGAVTFSNQAYTQVEQNDPGCEVTAPPETAVPARRARIRPKPFKIRVKDYKSIFD